MSVTPAKGRPSAIPTPGRVPSGIPSSGRPRSATGVHNHPALNANHEDEYISKAFADALKANDPANHRFNHTNDISLSPPSPHFPSQSGRRSVSGRSSSVASSSSAIHGTVRNAKPAPRPASRASDVFTRSSSRAGRPFDVGESVRVESLGFEGILRYLGEIDGKSGLFAGVELGGGFAGKGKNDGSVNGKRYFTCPPECGIFILANKLSAPTTGYGSISRPSSVASARNDRAPPSMSGRTTPSLSFNTANGRKTSSQPLSNGRITPAQLAGRVTPSASVGRRTPGTVLPITRPKTITASKNVTTPSKPGPSESTITPGSRASRYIGMTAKQLSSRGAGASSPSRKPTSPTMSFALISPTQSTYGLASPRAVSSPFTPKMGRMQGIGIGPPSGTPTRSKPGPGTPRARLPSAVSMPPPPSPSFSSRSVSLNDPAFKLQHNAEVDLAANGKAIQDLIGSLMTGRTSSRPSSSASITSPVLADQQWHLQIERLQARLDASDDENRRIRTSLAAAEASVDSLTSRLTVVTEDGEKLTSRVAELESAVRTAERSCEERGSTIEALERSAQQSVLDIEKVKSDGEARLRDIQSKLDDKEILVSQLKELIEAKEGLQNENDAVLSAKNAELALLDARVHKAYAELEEERRELGGQVDELRKAGQETIALYEERLSAADARRYEMEDLVTSLEDQLRIQARPVSPTTLARQAASAVEIDNEALKEQIQHLQQKLVSLEDAVEDAHLAAEREETAVRERVLRYKEREDGIRKELAESQKEVERVSKLEESARMRIEEIEEALRENTVALENARAEIEVLRAEVADLEGIATAAGSPPKALNKTSGALTGDLELLKAEKMELDRACKQRDEELAGLQDTIATLRLALDERTVELDTLRKKVNREAPINGLQESNKSSAIASPSRDLAAAKEEIKGHKHIIQELQKENAKENQRSKVLESENKLLVTEIAQLREDMRKLEDTFEQTLVREEKELDGQAAGSGSSEDALSLQKANRELKTKYEAEVEQLRRNMSEAERKSARAVHDLHKEIGELESLIESKIYREDELESEIDRLKERLAKSQKKSSKTGLPEDSNSSPSSISSLASASSLASSQPFPSRSNRFPGSESNGASQEVCEICERPGHDIFTCDILKDDRPLTNAGLDGMQNGDELDDLFCEDCEEKGHTADTCPHSMDVF